MGIACPSIPHHQYFSHTPTQIPDSCYVVSWLPARQWSNFNESWQQRTLILEWQFLSRAWATATKRSYLKSSLFNMEPHICAILFLASLESLIFSNLLSRSLYSWTSSWNLCNVVSGPNFQMLYMPWSIWPMTVGHWLCLWALHKLQIQLQCFKTSSSLFHWNHISSCVVLLKF